MAEADPGLDDILNLWQKANDRVLEKYPEGSEISFTQLEEMAKKDIET